MDLIVVLLSLCFIIGIISSTLFVAFLYAYRKSRRISESKAPNTHNVAPKKLQETKEDHQVIATSAVMLNQGDHDLLDEVRTLSRSNSLDNCSDCSSFSYMCDVCGSSCQREKELVGHKRGESDHVSPCHYSPSYPCGVLFVSGVDVGFKCQVCGDTGVGVCNEHDGGAFFFYRGRQLGEQMEPIAPSDQYLIMAALPSVPYHLWFCPSVHQAKSHRCSDCRRIFCFELCDMQIHFKQIDDGSEKWPAREVWILACEEAAGSNRVIYRGDTGSLISLHYTGKLFVYFGLADQVVLDASALPFSSSRRRNIAEFASGTVSLDKDQPTIEGDLINQHQKRRCDRQRNVSGGRCCSGENRMIDGNICRELGNNNDPDANTSATESIKIDQPPSPLSMDSMRKAVKWPITQIENLIESSSDDRVTGASGEDPSRTTGNTGEPDGAQIEVAAEWDGVVSPGLDASVEKQSKIPKIAAMDSD